MEQAENRRDDRAAKAAFCAQLCSEGYDDVRVVGTPTDIVASRAGVRWHFEVKYTRAKAACFGAATLTEWAAAARDPEHFRFVIAYENGHGWQFDRYTPDAFMAFSSVPPFKVYFSVPLNGAAARERSKNSKRIFLTKNRLRLLSRQFDELRAVEE